MSWKMFADILSLISQLRAPLWHDSAWRSDTSGDGVISAFRSRAKQRFPAPQRSIGRLDRLLRCAIYHCPRAMLAPRSPEIWEMSIDAPKFLFRAADPPTGGNPDTGRQGGKACA